MGLSHEKVTGSRLMGDPEIFHIREAPIPPRITPAQVLSDGRGADLIKQYRRSRAYIGVWSDCELVYIHDLPFSSCCCFNCLMGSAQAFFLPLILLSGFSLQYSVCC